MFYKIFMIGGIIDILAMANNYLGAIFPAKGYSRTQSVVNQLPFTAGLWSSTLGMGHT